MWSFPRRPYPDVSSVGDYKGGTWRQFGVHRQPPRLTTQGSSISKTASEVPTASQLETSK
jgi:hypothetical protein